MRTIEQIRLENFATLVSELGKDAGDQDVATHLGISKVYAWQLRTGKRSSIDSKVARLVEIKMEKPVGWMDTDFTLWPFPDIPPDRLHSLKTNQKIEIQGQVRSWIEKFEIENAELIRKKNGTSN